MARRRFRLDQPDVAACHDVAMAALSYVVALYLRLGSHMFAYAESFFLQGMLLFTAVCAVVFWRFRLYRGLWRYASLPDLIALTKAVTLAVLIFLPLMFLLTRLELYPRSTLVINWFVLLFLLGAPRLLYRLFKDGNLKHVFERTADSRIPVLLAGVGDGAELFIREMARDETASYRVVGLVDPDKAHLGRRIHGIEVMGDLESIPEVVARMGRRDGKPQRLILTSDAFDGETVARLLETTDRLGLTVARLPRLTDFRSGVAGHLEVKAVAIEDLLGRPQTVLDRPAIAALIEGRRVMVTGAGGTIGAELVRQVATLEPSRLTLFDLSEINLFRIDNELDGHQPGLPRSAVLGDVRDRRRLDAVIGRERPQLLFHAAALKQVPMLEANLTEAVMTNVLGTRNVADACRASGVATMVMISTDKAVNPAGVMGATKRVAEIYCQALGVNERTRAHSTRYLTVRFGNVLGSAGSVVELFQDQIAAGGPVTVTHPEVTRYIMTVREAVELVLQASALGGEGGEIFVLDMGVPVRIQDLARQMIRLAGLRPDTDVRIEFIGLRPGEKLHEELFHPAEQAEPTATPGILVARPRPADLDALVRRLDELTGAARRRRRDETLALVRRLVPEYAGAEQDATPTARG